MLCWEPTCDLNMFQMHIIGLGFELLQTSYLLLHGELPSAKQNEDFVEEVNKHMLLKKDLMSFFEHFPTNAHPMVR